MMIIRWHENLFNGCDDIGRPMVIAYLAADYPCSIGCSGPVVYLRYFVATLFCLFV